MAVSQIFEGWLTREYISPKFKKPLKGSSARQYVLGIHSLSKKLRIKKGEGLFAIINSNELTEIAQQLYSINITKDEQSHFFAYQKFIKDKYEQEKRE